MRYAVLFIVLLVPCLATPARAGVLFGRKKEKIDPKTRVPELIATLQADKDADKRARAAEELRNYDPVAFPDIVPALIAALQGDAKPAVRSEAAQSLGKLRPVNQAAGEALEQALATDPSMRVRLQARSSLLSYHWAGYRSGKKTEIPPLTSPVGGSGKEPPLIKTTPGASPPPPVPQSSGPALKPVPAGSLKKPAPAALTPPVPSTKEPPLAPPVPSAGEPSGPELP